MADRLSRTVAAPRVLVVDDDPLVVELMREVLGRSGNRVLSAVSPDEALAVLAAERVDLVLTDIRLPGFRSGFDLLGELRERYPSVPVLLVTGSARGEASLSEALDRGAAGFLAKPFTLTQLRAKVEQTLQHKRRAEAEVRARVVRPTIATALANAIEVKNAGMEGHVERLGEIALAIGGRLELSDQELESLELGAVLHDVGKIGIPDAVLLKPHALDADEREIMKAHTVIGDQMLRHLDLDEIRPVVRHHHEWWDGSGYPDGLAGEEIPLLARIVAVADSIEAMSAYRLYRDPLSPDQVLEELDAGSGRQWDSRIVGVARELIDVGVIRFDMRRPAAAVAPLTAAKVSAGSGDLFSGRGSDLLRALTADPQVGVFVSDASGACAYVNDGWCRLSGLAAEEALGDGWATALHPDDRGRVLAEWSTAAESGEDSAAEYRFLRPDGSVSLIHGFASALRDERGKLRGWIGTCLDLTARRDAEEAVAKANERFRVAFDGAPIGMALVSPEGRWLQVNVALCELLGYSAAELDGRSFLDITHPGDLDASAESRQCQLEGGPAVTRIEKRFIRSDGQTIWVAVSSSMVEDGDRRPLYSVAQVEDITERVLTQRTLREAEERFRRAFDDAPIGMALVGLDGRWLSVNQSLCAITGYSEAELQQRTVRDITHPDDLESDVEQVERLLEGEIAAYQMEKRYLHADGEIVWVRLSVSLVKDADGAALHFISQVEDISERKQAEERLRHLADHDALTELLNRRRFSDDLARECERLGRHGERLAALLLLDVDRFKRINDTLGHHAGDDVLKAVAQTLTHRLRATDVVARLGGDEFAALVVDLENERDAQEIARELAQAIRSKAILTRSGPAQVTVSIGVVLLTAETASRTVDPLIAVDNAMYRAKRAGRNRISLAA